MDIFFLTLNKGTNEAISEMSHQFSVWFIILQINMTLWKTYSFGRQLATYIPVKKTRPGNGL